MPTTSAQREVIGGVDTHKHTHHAAAIDASTGKLLGDNEFPATAAGYHQLLDWLSSHGVVVKIGVEGTGSYGQGLLRFLTTHHIEVVEVTRPVRQARYLRGKSDPLDAISAARAVLAHAAIAVPKGRSGPAEAIRIIHTTRASAVKARKAAINQIHAALVTADDDLRSAIAGRNRAVLVRHCAALDVDNTRLHDPAIAVRACLRTLARRVQQLDLEIAEANRQLTTLVRQTAPTIIAVFGVGPEIAAQLLCTAGDNPDRLHSEAALARLCGTAPIPASSGTTTRHRLHRGGDRGANRALHLLVINRLRWHHPTHDYVTRRLAEGKTKKEIIRCLKRAVIREIYKALTADLTPA